jgi:hypothetical protein
VAARAQRNRALVNVQEEETNPMKTRSHLVIAAFALGFAAMSPAVGSAQYTEPSAPDCWHGSWSNYTVGTGSQTCTNWVFSQPISATVWNTTNYNGIYKYAHMKRISPNCGYGNAYLWINTTELDINSGTYIPWWWRSNNTQTSCTFQLTRPAYDLDYHAIVNSRCRVELCNSPH